MDLLVTQLFEEWVRRRGIQGAVLDADGMAAFEIDQGLVVNIQARSSPPALTLFTLAAQLPSELPAEQRCIVLEDVLEANLLWQATAGATLSLRSSALEEGRDLVVAQELTVHKGSAVTELDRIFDNLCLVSLDWKTRIENRVALGERGKYDPASPEQLISMHP